MFPVGNQGIASSYVGESIARGTPEFCCEQEEIRMRIYAIVTILILMATNASADRVLGDLDGSGKVDFEDFLIFAGNFGKEGDIFNPDEPVGSPTDTIRITVHDTVQITNSETVSILPNGETVESLGQGKLWTDTEDWFSKEPFTASFRAGDFDFTLINFHAIIGSSENEIRTEGALIDDVYQAIQDEDPLENDVIVLGNFNLAPEDLGMVQMNGLLTPLIKGDTKTTVTASSLVDNIWLPSASSIEYTGRYGVDRFDQTVYGDDDEAATMAVSDHRPVWARFATSREDDD